MAVIQDLEIRLFERMEPLEAEWRKLEADPANSLHQAYDWCACWVKAHRNPLAIILGRRNGETVFILPLEIVRHGMVRSAQFIAARFNNINSGLFSAAFRASAGPAEAVLIREALTDLLASRADLVSLTNIPLEWRGERHPLASLPAIENQNHAFQLPLIADFEQTIGQLNAKRRRKKFRNQCRKLEGAGGFDHVIAQTSKQKNAMLDAFFEQKAIRFKAIGIPNVFQAPETQAFFRLLLDVDTGSHDTPLELHAIRLKGEFKGRIAAIAGLSRKGDHVICQFGSIDEDLVADASPGELLFWFMIERACEEGARLFDFGLGDQGYKRSWCTVETVQHDILVPISALGRLASMAQRGMTRAKAVIKGNPQLYSVIQRLRAHADEVPVRSTGTDS
ncbi:MAG: GNAT family N-acetyltransferase [Rhizobium sp.]|nr:GNAT family N-acetyltransferase [Rhizobium sp.]